jgi:hypothetical protein
MFKKSTEYVKKFVKEGFKPVRDKYEGDSDFYTVTNRLVYNSDLQIPEDLKQPIFEALKRTPQYQDYLVSQQLEKYNEEQITALTSLSRFDKFIVYFILKKDRFVSKVKAKIDKIIKKFRLWSLTRKGVLFPQQLIEPDTDDAFLAKKILDEYVEPKEEKPVTVKAHIDKHAKVTEVVKYAKIKSYIVIPGKEVDFNDPENKYDPRNSPGTFVYEGCLPPDYDWVLENSLNSGYSSRPEERKDV